MGGDHWLWRTGSRVRAWAAPAFVVNCLTATNNKYIPHFLYSVLLKSLQASAESFPVLTSLHVCVFHWTWLSVSCPGLSSAFSLTSPTLPSAGCTDQCCFGNAVWHTALKSPWLRAHVARQWLQAGGGVSAPGLGHVRLPHVPSHSETQAEGGDSPAWDVRFCSHAGGLCLLKPLITAGHLEKWPRQVRGQAEHRELEDSTPPQGERRQQNVNSVLKWSTYFFH